MLQAGEKFGWKSEACSALAYLLERRFPEIDAPERCIFASEMNSFQIKEDISFSANASTSFVSWSDLPVLPFNLGNGNCLDNSTLQSLFGSYSLASAFQLRVQKGLHFVRNLGFYQDAYHGIEELQDEDLPLFCRIFFQNGAYQSPFHDVPAASLLNRPFHLHFPEVYSHTFSTNSS